MEFLMHRGRQRGALIVVAIVLIVVVALLVVSLSFLTVANVSSSAGHSQSEEALFAANAGLENASYQFSNGTLCGSLTNTNVAVGSASFTTSGTLFKPARTTLSAAITAASTVIPVASITGYASRGQIRIDNEEINYTGTSASAGVCGTAPCFTGALRGASGSTAVAHLIATAVSQNMCEITSTGTSGSANRVLKRVSRFPGATFAYAKLDGDRVPYYRRWDGTAWGPEATATTIGGASNINFMVLKFARTRNEAILGIQDSAGAITVQIWNGSSWGAVTAVGTATATFRGFDIEYESNSDQAVIAYHTGVAAQFSYRIWNGSTLSAATNVALPAGFLALHWIEMAPNPLASSDEIAVMMTNNAAAGAGRIYGMRWTGSAWNNMGVATAWDTAAANTATNIIDVAYEQLSGDILFVWGATASNLLYRTYSGGVLSANTTLNIKEFAGTPNWVRLAPDPSSNNIMLAATDTGSDLDTRRWTGAAWDCNGGAVGACTAHPEHSTGVQNILNRNFDVVFETHPSNTGIAWLVWADGGTGFVTRRRWNTATTSWAAVTTSGSNTAYVRLVAHPYKDSGAVFAGIYEDRASATDDITAMQLTAGGTVWPAPVQIWAGQIVANPVQNRIAIDTENALDPVDAYEVYP